MHIIINKEGFSNNETIEDIQYGITIFSGGKIYFVYESKDNDGITITSSSTRLVIKPLSARGVNISQER